MDKRSVLVVSLLSLFLLFSFRGYAEPTYTNNVSSPVITYSPTAYSNFSITWDDISGNVNAYLENNFSGTLANWSMQGSYPTFTNNTSVLAAKTYQYRFVANNSSGNENSTPILYFTINKADNPVNLYLNDTLNDSRTYIYPQIINATATSTVGTVHLYRDELSKGTNEQVLLGAGTYAYKVNATGNENYSENSGITYYAVVNPASTNIVLWLNGTGGSRSYNQNDIANFTAHVNVSGLVINLTSNYPGWTELTNTTTVYNTTNLSSIGIFYIRGYTNENDNYTASSQTYYFDTREPQYSDLIFPPSLAYVPNQNYYFNITLTDASINTTIFRLYNTTPTGGGTVSYTINPNSVLINDTTKTFYVNITDLPAGSYNYSWYANDSLGKFNSTGNLTYVVTKGNAIGALTVSPGTSITSGTQTTVTCPNLNRNAGRSEIDVTLKLEQNLVSNPDIRTLGVGTWNYYCTATDTGNYTNVQQPITITVSETGSTTNTGTGTGTGTTPTGSFIIKDLTSALTILTDESKSTSFTLSDTLSNNIANVTISVSGINSSWYTLSKNSISILKRNVPETMSITFKIPSNAEAKDYDVTITAKGKALGETSSRTATKTMKLTVNSSQPQPIQPLPSVTETPQPQLATVQQNETANITSNQTSVVTGLAPAFEFFKSNLVIIIAVAACLLIFMFRNNLTAALGGTIGKEEPEKTHKSASPLKGLKDKLNYKLIVNLKKESKAKNLKETTEVQDTKVPEAIPEMVPEKEPKRPAVLEKEIKRDIKELQSILDAEKKVGKNKKKFGMNNN